MNEVIFNYKMESLNKEEVPSKDESIKSLLGKRLEKPATLEK